MLFKHNGYRAIHWSKGEIANKIRRNLSASMPLLFGIENYHSYSDMELLGEFYAYYLFPLLDLQYENSIFIYNFRDIDKWIQSRLNHKFQNKEYSDAYLEKHQKLLPNFIQNKKELTNHWKDVYQRHEKIVFKYFENKSNLIKLNISDENSHFNLCKKLREVGFKIDQDKLEHYGKTK